MPPYPGLLALALFGALMACSRYAVVASSTPEQTAPPARPLPADVLDARLILVGGAGWGNGAEKGLPGTPERPNPVLAAVGERAAERPERTLIVFLGDNILGPVGRLNPFQGGMPEAAMEGLPERLAARVGDEAGALQDFSLYEHQLLAQLDPARESGARAILVPGNHDYYIDGYPGVLRQARFIEAYNEAYGLPDGQLRLVPEGACSGPAAIRVGEHLSVLAIDTMFWLARSGINQQPINPDCPVRLLDDFVEQLQTVLSAQGERQVVLAGHHPHTSYGKHGRMRGLGALLLQQEMTSAALRKLMAAIDRAAADRSPLAMVASHDHNLQVLPGQRSEFIDGPSAFQHFLVSGAGSLIHRGEAWYPGPELAAFVSAEAGFMVLESDTMERVRLEVVEVVCETHDTESCVARVPYARWLSESRP